MPKRCKSPKRDRISDLPDDVLVHIIGKLPTKYAVGTSILSTRWSNLFAQIPVPDISIDDSDILHLHPDIRRHSKYFSFLYRQREPIFIEFMNNYLNITLHNIPRIRKFHLEINHGLGLEHVNNWVSTALRLNVSYLWIVGPSEFKYHTPLEGIFFCASLVEIFLEWRGGIIVPSSVNLPNLKCLYLNDVAFDNDDLRKVLCGCPVLEELCLCYCKFRVHQNADSHAVQIFSSSVKSFKWKYCVMDRKYQYGIKLDLPTLDSLWYNDVVPAYFLVKNLRSLRKVYINTLPMCNQLEGSQHEDRVRYLKNVADLVVGCSNAEVLSLADHSVEAIDCNLNSLKPFVKLVELELFPKLLFHGWKLMPYLLTNAPNLELLVFGKEFKTFKGCYCIFLRHMRQCRAARAWLASNLQRVRFETFNGEDDELKLMKYFLNNAKGLRNIEIKMLSEEMLVETVPKLEAMQQRSKKSNVEFKFRVLAEWEEENDRPYDMRE